MQRRQVNRYVWTLQETRSVTLDASGNGTIFLSPGTARERWLITLINVSCTQTTASIVPQMLMFRSSPVAVNRLGGTYNAVGDTNSSDQILLNMNEPIYFVFSGGELGDVATIRIEGSRYVWE